MIEKKNAYNDYSTHFPNSRKVHVTGSRDDIQVPLREIKLSDTETDSGVIENDPVRVYDTSGPYTDPAVEIDLHKGLPAARPRVYSSTLKPVCAIPSRISTPAIHGAQISPTSSPPNSCAKKWPKAAQSFPRM